MVAPRAMGGSSPFLPNQSTTGSQFGNNKKKADDSYKNPSVAKEEERRVLLSKYTMLAVLALVAAGFSTATFLLLKAEEENTFREQVRR
jgi:hypothetical protein